MDKFHLIGIKGSGMSALAQILFDLGHHVQGEDTSSFIFTQAPLASRNIAMYDFGAAPLSSDMKAIASNAFDDSHPAILRCKELGIPVYRYHHFLGEWMKDYTSVAITGAHGKTTTTGMMAHAFKSALPVCSLIGDGTGEGVSGARLLVFESCEYRRHFLAYRPDIAIITNIDFDHPDYFADMDDVRRAFEQMASQTGKQLIVCGDDPQIRRMDAKADRLHYGFGEDNELRAANVAVVAGQGVTFDAYYKGTLIEHFFIPTYGNHNVLNALAVIGAALALDLDMGQIKAGLATFAGVKRRFSEKRWGTNVVVDDYAHHPSEIKVTLEAARSKYPDKKIVGIFQPHTFTRLEKLLDDFAESLNGADDVYLCPIFGSPREGKGNVAIEDLQSKIPDARLVSGHIASDLSAYRDSVLIFMGAGDIQKYEEALFEA